MIARYDWQLLADSCRSRIAAINPMLLVASGKPALSDPKEAHA